jgi:HTH-type transcriptional regulator / antitoxin HigA
MENIRPIKTDGDYHWAIEEITRYFENQPEPGSPDGDRFDVLATLIEAYEDSHYPISVPDPVDMITAHMQMRGLTRKDLAELLGSAPRASEILGRKRAITIEMAHKLNRRWGIPADVLIQPYRLAQAK